MGCIGYLVEVESPSTRPSTATSLRWTRDGFRELMRDLDFLADPFAR